MCISDVKNAPSGMRFKAICLMISAGSVILTKALSQMRSLPDALPCDEDEVMLLSSGTNCCRRLQIGFK